MAWIAAGAAFLIALVLGRISMTIGLRLGIVDRPDDDLKTHTGSPVPLGGVALLVGALVGLQIGGALEVGLLVAVLLVWAIGLIDDLRGLHPLTRLFGALVAGVLLVTLGGPVEDTVVAVFWVVAVVVVVNAVNLFDGLDALAGTVGAIALAGMLWLGAAKGATDPLTLLAVVGALLGFLAWNRPPARLYLGDNGAYVLGVLLVWAATWVSTDRMAGVVAIALVGMPLIDLGATVFRRGLSGAPFFSGDRDHTYDRLYQEGLSPAGVVLVFGPAQALWVVAVVGVSILWGDVIAAVTALVLGLALAAVVGIRSTLTER